MVYNEVQYLLTPFVLISVVVLAIVTLPFMLQEGIFFLFILAIIFVFFGKLTVAVDMSELRISYGFLPIIKKSIPLASIEKKSVTEFRSLREFGGWGIRIGKHNGERTGCYTIRGNKGVLLTLQEEIRCCFSKTNKLIIGSSDPETLILYL